MPDQSNLFPLSHKPPLPGGYMGKLLRVDLTSGTMREEDLPEQTLLKKLIGGQALASYILLDVGLRFLEPIPDGKYQGFTIAKWLPALVYEYYRLSGRHERTGRPFQETLAKLGLEEFIEWSQPEE